jgi:hypothetical protein
MARYPLAKWQPSEIQHPMRRITLGIVIHNTYGHEAGDVTTLDGPAVDAHFYVAKDGDTYQFLDTGSSAWTAKATANATCVQIETEGKRSEPWTPAQLSAVADLTAWVCKLYGIPIRKVDPTSPADLSSFRGLFDHRDLAGIDGNNHTDGVPDGTGWPRFLAAIKAASAPRLTLGQRLRRAGLGPNSVRAVLKALEQERRTRA